MKKVYILLPILVFASVGLLIKANSFNLFNHAPKNSEAQLVAPSSLILNAEGTANYELDRLLAVTQISHENSLQSIVDATQKAWLRQAGKERWQSDDIYAGQNFTQEFESLGMIHEVAPTQSHYNYAIMLGATAKRVRTRLAHLAELYKQGIHFDSIVFLGSDRPLDKDIENQAMLLDSNNTDLPCKANWQLQGALPTTEMTMMQMVYEQADLPESFRDIPVIFINTANFAKPDGAIRRANTQDTLEQWLKTNPKAGSCLFISNQPYIGYQDSVVRTYMPATFYVESVGSQASSSVRNAELFDTLARTLYQENIRRNKK